MIPHNMYLNIVQYMESISQYAINAEGVTAGLGKIKKPEATEYLQTIYLFIYLVVIVAGR